MHFFQSRVSRFDRENDQVAVAVPAHTTYGLTLYHKACSQYRSNDSTLSTTLQDIRKGEWRQNINPAVCPHMLQELR